MLSALPITIQTNVLLLQIASQLDVQDGLKRTKEAGIDTPCCFLHRPFIIIAAVASKRDAGLFKLFKGFIEAYEHGGSRWRYRSSYNYGK
jgi:hypothetical protein